MLKVTMDSGRVKEIQRDTTPDWITANTRVIGSKPVLPPLPEWMKPLIIGGNTLKEGLTVIPASGQFWNELKVNQQAQLLELVEWLGGNADQYVRDFEKMYPNSPRGK